MKEHIQFIQAGKLNFRVLVQGEGPPVLLLHGFPDDLNVWSKLTPQLIAAGYQVIAFDQRGFGETDAPPGRSHYKIKNIVEDIPLVLTALNIKEPVHVLAHDWGAVIGWCFSILYPEQVKSLVAVSVGHPQSYGRAGLNQKLIKGFYTLWFQVVGLSEYYLLHGGFKRWMPKHSETEAVINNMSRPGRLTAALNWYRANFVDVLIKSWPHCQVPTLGIWSERDDYLIEEQMQDSKKYMDADWKYLRIDNSGHWIPLEQPKKLAAAALDWFAKYNHRG